LNGTLEQVVGVSEQTFLFGCVSRNLETLRAKRLEHMRSIGFRWSEQALEHLIVSLVADNKRAEIR
jgi:hypothetical protein